MIRTIYIYITILLASGCGSQREGRMNGEEGRENDFILKGTVINMSSSVLIFEKMNGAAFITNDTIRTEPDGSFCESLTLEYPAFYALKNQSGERILLLPHVSDTLIIKADYQDLSEYSISGNDESLEILELHKKTRNFMKQIDEIARITKDSLYSADYSTLKIELHERFDSLYEEFRTFSLEFINRNQNSPVSMLALNNVIGRDFFVFDLQEDFDVYAEVDSVLFELYPDFPGVKNQHDKLNVVRLQMKMQNQERAPE